ncbi:MAG: GtrA family protein [Euryarchaeota archaeon]|nr:GtrA family protein [Euryarchaeota archaeon]
MAREPRGVTLDAGLARDAPAPSTGSLAARLARFAVVGGNGAVLNLSLLTLFIEVFGWHFLLASAVAIELSTVINYFLNRSWTWGDRDRSFWSLLSYHGVVMVGLVVQWAVLATGVAFFDLHYLLAGLIGIAAGTGWNFFANHHVTFTHYTPERRERYLRIALYAAAFVLHLGIAAILTHDWDTYVFQSSVEQFLTEGTSPYSVGLAKPAFVYWNTLQPLWYAYPPLPLLLMSVPFAPAAFGAVTAPWAARILIKLPFILATLAFAGLTRRFLESSPGEGTAKKAILAERFLLFNPLFLLVADVWGQFESLLLVLLVLSFLALRAARWNLAGAAFGTAALVKVFPAYLVPILGIWLWRRAGPAAFWRYFLTAAAVFSLVSLPFFFAEPRGFLEQVLLMHGARDPGRFAPIAFMFNSLKWATRAFPGTLPGDEGISEALSVLSFTATAVLLILVALASSRKAATEGNLVTFCALGMAAGILGTKLVSEQYLILPLGLLTLALYHPGSAFEGATAKRVGRLLLALAGFVTLAAFLDHAFFLVLVPDDVARFLFQATVHEKILTIAALFSMTPTQLRTILGGAAGFGLTVPFYYALRILGPVFLEGLRALTPILHLHPAIRRAAGRTHVTRITVVALVALLLAPALAIGAFAPKRELPSPTAGVIEADALLLAHYRADWFNPVVRPDTPGGNWVRSLYTPASGYYNAMPHKVEEDVVLLREAGVDAVVLRFHPAFEHQAFGVVQGFEAHALPYTMEIQLRDIADASGRVALTRSNAQAVLEMLNGPDFGYWDPGYHLRLAADAPPVLFVSGLELVQATFDEAERKYVAEAYIATLPPSIRRSYAALPVPLWQQLPTSRADLEANTATGALGREAYAAAKRAFWQTAFSFLEPAEPTARLDLVVDVRPDYDIGRENPVRIVGRYDPIGADAHGPPDGLLLATVNARPGEASAFDAALADAASSGARGLLVPWNDFDAGLAVEPTREGGRGLLDHLIEAGASRGDAETTPVGSP